MQSAAPSAYSWNRFSTPGLTIAAELAGGSHVFEHRGLNVRIVLPSATRGGEHEDSRLHVTARWAADGTPIQFDVFDVDVCVDQPNSPELRAALVEPRPEHIDKSGVISRMGDFAAQAFEYWLRVIRWRTRHWRIGRLRKHRRARWGTYLYEHGPNRRLAQSVTTITVPADRKITADEWGDDCSLRRRTSGTRDQGFLQKSNSLQADRMPRGPSSDRRTRICDGFAPRKT